MIYNTLAWAYFLSSQKKIFELTFLLAGSQQFWMRFVVVQFAPQYFLTWLYIYFGVSAGFWYLPSHVAAQHFIKLAFSKAGIARRRSRALLLSAVCSGNERLVGTKAPSRRIEPSPVDSLIFGRYLCSVCFSYLWLERLELLEQAEQLLELELLELELLELLELELLELELLELPDSLDSVWSLWSL